MARHAQPREVAKLKGADRKNPQRYRNDPPKSTMPIGAPPDRMPEEVKKCWFEIESLCAKGVLTGADRIMLEVTSHLFAQFLKDPVGFTSARLTHLRGSIAQLGMTPTDRQKLGVDSGDSEDDDSFEEF